MSEDNLNLKVSDNEMLKLSEKEHSFLRTELAHLKDCQIKFLTFSVTATGIILGMIGKSKLSLSEGLTISENMWLLPLVVLIPAWWVFFDKATTITRIVGYFRVIEKLILKKADAQNYAGWESSLSEFREEKSKEKVKVKFKEFFKLLKILTLQTSNRYWVITYYIFLSLSLICWFASWKQSHEPIKVVAGFAILISSLWNIYVLWALSFGEFSYNNNEQKWIKLLRIVDR